MVVGRALDIEGRPICCEMWPGNTADVKTLTPIVKRMRERFRLREITVVADRGMVSQATLEASQEERSAGALYRWSADAPAEGSEHFGTWQPCTMV
jgi:transposase